MFVESLQGCLATNSDVQVKLGTATSRSDGTTGLFPVQAPDEVPLPYCVYSQVFGEPLQTSMRGTGALQSARWRMSCYGADYKAAKLLAKIVKAALVSMYGPQAVGNTFVQGAWLVSEVDDAEPIPHGTLYATHVDFTFNYIETD